MSHFSFASGEKGHASYRRTAAIVGTLILVIFIATLYHSAAMQREAIASFSSTLLLGMRRDDVTRRCERACLEHTGWSYHPDLESFGGSVSLVESPMTFGARNWIVYVAFNHNAVTAVLVRTPDTRRLKPEDAPRDRIDNAIHAPWLAEFYD